jgi:anti-sigma-K factor RskA
MNCITCQPLLAEYALGLLQDDERNVVSSHLATGCSDCARVLRETEEAWVLLVDTLPPADVPEKLEGALRRRMNDGERSLDAQAVGAKMPFAQRFPITEADARPRHGGATPMNYASARPAFTPEHQEIAISSGRRLSAKGWILAATVFIASGIGLAVWLSDRGDGRGQAGSRSDDDLRLEYDRITRLFGGTRLHLASLHERDRQAATRGYVVWDRLSRQIHFYAFDLQPPAEGRVYRIWIVRDGGEPLSVGTFAPQPNGTASVLVDVPAEVTPPFHIGVTEQDASAPLSPQGAPWLTSEVE